MTENRETSKSKASPHPDVTPFILKYRGAALPVCCISGVRNSQDEQVQGQVYAQMLEALQTSRERGDAFMVTMPANRRLYFYFDKFDFASVFFIRERRYVDVHIFPDEPGFETVEPDFKLFSALEETYDGIVRHDEGQFEILRQALSKVKGGFRAVCGPDGERAFAAYTVKDGELRVRLLLSETGMAEEAVLAAVKRDFPLNPVVVEAIPEDDAPALALEARGMARLINPVEVFSALAAYKTSSKYTIRLTDRLLPENSAVYRLSHGRCEVLPFDTEPGKVRGGELPPFDLDVTPATMCKILFSGRKMANIFGLPVTRGFMGLMPY